MSPGTHDLSSTLGQLILPWAIWHLIVVLSHAHWSNDTVVNRNLKKYQVTWSEMYGVKQGIKMLSTLFNVILVILKQLQKLLFAKDSNWKSWNENMFVAISANIYIFIAWYTWRIKLSATHHVNSALNIFLCWLYVRCILTWKHLTDQWWMQIIGS